MTEQIYSQPLKDAFYEKFPENHKIIEYFEEANNCEFTWENLTKVRLQRYVNYMNTKIAPNSVKSYCSKIKSVLTLYNEEVELPKDYNKVLQVHRDNSQHVYIDDDEIRKIMKYTPRNRAESVIKNWFLIGCFTGARHSDYITFTSKNIWDGMLHYVSIKTHISSDIPVSPVLEKLIGDNNELGYNDFRCSDVYFNRVLKEICRKSGIDIDVKVYTKGKFQQGPKWKFVSSHTARRSFATNLYKQGVDIYTISRLCGHSSVDMTKQYICCGPVISDNVLDYLKTFGDVE